jgi:hypothetical protein
MEPTDNTTTSTHPVLEIRFKSGNSVTKYPQLTLREGITIPEDFPLGVSARTKISSSNVFHSPHEGQRPIHLADCAPQFLQKNEDFDFAIQILF